MNRNEHLIEAKLKLWLCLSSIHPDDLTRSEMFIWSGLENDADIEAYVRACNKAEENLDMKEWSYKRYHGFSKDSNKCKK